MHFDLGSLISSILKQYNPSRGVLWGQDYVNPRCPQDFRNSMKCPSYFQKVRWTERKITLMLCAPQVGSTLISEQSNQCWSVPTFLRNFSINEDRPNHIRINQSELSIYDFRILPAVYSDPIFHKTWKDKTSFASDVIYFVQSEQLIRSCEFFSPPSHVDLTVSNVHKPRHL